MGKRRKKYKRVVKREVKVPTVFQCPRCGAKTLSVRFEKTDTPVSSNQWCRLDLGLHEVVWF